MQDTKQKQEITVTTVVIGLIAVAALGISCISFVLGRTAHSRISENERLIFYHTVNHHQDEVAPGED